MTENGDRVALVIASYKYQDPSLRQLVAPAEDAEALAEVLRDPAIGGFRVQTLVNKPHDVVRREIVSLFQNRRLDDLVLLYYSGHGIKDQDGRLYLATIDTDHNVPIATAVEDSLIQGMMHRSRSRKQVLILDCCYSGAFAQGMVPRGTERIGTVEHFKGRGRVVLTASDAMQYAFEGNTVSGEGVRSVFTSSLVEGLRTGEADINRDGLVSIDELYDYVHNQVHLKTPNQIPEISTYGAQGNLQIARNPVPIVTRADLPAALQAALESPDSLARYGAASELERMLGDDNPGMVLAALEELEKLKDDDSRRVSSKATEARDAYHRRREGTVTPAAAGQRSKAKLQPAPPGATSKPASASDEPFSVGISPTTASGSTSAAYRVNIQNHSRRPEQFTISRKSDNQFLRYELDRDTLTVGPGKSANAGLSVHTTTEKPGGGKRQPFSVRVRSDSSGEIRAAQATFVQQAGRSMWVTLLVIISVLGLSACACLFIAALIGESSSPYYYY